jgi:hypothetical protein
MGRAAIALFALAALGMLLALLLRGRPDDGPREASRRPEEVATERAATLVPTAKREETHARQGTRDAVVLLATAPSPAAHVAKPPTTRPFVGALVVRVVDEEERPIAGAIVDLVTWRRTFGPFGVVHDNEREEARYRGRATVARMVRLWNGVGGSERAATDEEGRVHFHHVAYGGTIRARDSRGGAELAGSLELDHRTARVGAEYVLPLRPVRAVDVRVVDASGAPAPRVPVVVTTRGADLSEPWNSIAQGGDTDHEGRVRIVDVDGRWKSLPGLPVVRALVLDPVPIEAALEDADEVVLALPPMGRVVVELPYASDGWIQLAATGSRAWASAEGARATFEHVAMDLVCTASVDEFGTGEPFAGPTAPGETIVHRWSADGGRLTITPVDAEGGRLRSHAMALVYEWEVGDGYRSSMNGARRTDADGALHLPLATWSRLPLQTIRLTGEWFDERGRGRARSGSVDVPRALPKSGVLDLGEVILEPLELLGAGRVVDGEGHPVARAFVWADAGNGERAGSTSSDSDGFFVLEAEKVPAERELTLFANAPGHTQARTAITLGAEDVAIVLSTGGHVEFTLELDTAARHRELQVVLVGSEERGIFRRDHAARSIYVAEGVPEGPWTLRLAPAPAGDSLFERPFSIEAGRRIDLGVIDLSLDLPLFELHVEDEKGEALPYAATVLVGDSRTLEHSRGGPTTRVDPGDDARVRVEANGREPVEVPIARPRTVVRLGPVRRVVAVLPTGYPAPREDSEFALVFARVAPNGSRVPFRWVEPAPDNRYTVDLGTPGRFAALLVQGEFQRNLARVEFEVTEEQLASGAVIELPFDLDAWRAAIEGQ